MNPRTATLHSIAPPAPAYRITVVYSPDAAGKPRPRYRVSCHGVPVLEFNRYSQAHDAVRGL